MNWDEESLKKLLEDGKVKINKNSMNKITTEKERNKKVDNYKKQKLNNKPKWCDGVFFRSKLEMNKYLDLKLLLRAKEILGFCIQPEFILVEGSDKDNRAITYKADFIVFYKDGSYEIIDTKGFETETFKRVKKMFKNKFPELKIKIEKG